MGKLNTTAQAVKAGDMLLAIGEDRRRYPQVVTRTPGQHVLGAETVLIRMTNDSYQPLVEEYPVTVLRPETTRERARVYTWLAKHFSRLIGTGREWEEEGETLAKLMHLMEHGCEAQNLDVYILRVIGRYDRVEADSASRYVSYMA